MTMMTRTESLVRRGGAIILSLFLVACDTDALLEVPDPDVATPESVKDKAALPAVLAAALGDYMVAYNGTGDGQISMTGLFSDELIWAETFPTRFEVDVRSVQITNVTTEGIFRNLHRARISASRAADGYARLDTASRAQWAEALNLEGLTYVHFGENYCNGVPFSSLDAAGNQVYGSGQTNDEAFVLAIARFDSAINVTGALTAAAVVLQRNVARVGKARALLDRNLPATAATAVAGVPTFTYNIAHSQNTARQNNGLFNLVYDGRRFGVGQLEGVNGLPFRTDAAAGDNRVPNARGTGALSFGFDGVTPFFVQAKYNIRDAAAPVATGLEARLIEAEADLRAGGAAWITILNTLRAANVPALAALVDPVTVTLREDMLFKERAYWLWLTAHRMSDMRRLVRQYSRLATAVFPSGAYFKGGLYGTDVNFPIPFDEKNNPNFVDCANRNP